MNLIEYEQLEFEREQFMRNLGAVTAIAIFVAVMVGMIIVISIYSSKTWAGVEQFEQIQDQQRQVEYLAGRMRK